MMTEIESMLANIRAFGFLPWPVADLSEGPRVGGERSTYAEECRAAFTCGYCGGHNPLQCSVRGCAVQRIEPSSFQKRGRSEGT